MSKDKQLKLVKKAIAGDKDALDQLIIARQQDILYIANHYIKNKSMAEDVAQNAIIEIYTRITSLRNPQAFDFWLYRIVMLVSKNTNRNQNVRFTVPYEEDFLMIRESKDEFLPQDFIENQEKLDILINEFIQMPENYQEALFLKYFSEFSYAEISEIMGLTEMQVGNLLIGARKKLRERLEKRIGKKFSKIFMLSAAPTPILTQALRTDADRCTADMAKNISTESLEALQIKPGKRGLSSQIIKMLSVAGVIAAAGAMMIYAGWKGSQDRLSATENNYTQEAGAASQNDKVVSGKQPEAEAEIEEPETAAEPEQVIPEESTVSLPVQEQKRSGTVYESEVSNSAYYEVTGDTTPIDMGKEEDPEERTNDVVTGYKVFEESDSNDTESRYAAKTGDDINYWGYMILIAASFVLVGIYIKRRKNN